MKIGKISLPRLTRKNIKMTEEQIVRKFLGLNKFPTLISNPLRKDTNPSMGVFINHNQRIGFKDFATGQYYNLIGFMMELYGFNKQELYEFLNSKTTKQDLKKIKGKKRGLSKLVDLKVKIRDWNKEDLEYWESYGISKEYLIRFSVFPISHIIMQYDTESVISIPHRLSYVYVEFKDNKTSLKIYQPLASRENKFKNNHNNSVWDLWNALPEKGDKLIITSSRKDAMCLWANLNIPSICMQSESVIPKKQVIEELKRRFSTIYVLYDNDYNNSTNPGQLFGNRLASDYNLINICIPTELESKDASDLYKNRGKEVFITTINHLLNQQNNEKSNSNLCITTEA